jgi:hypothetical protein
MVYDLLVIKYLFRKWIEMNILYFLVFQIRSILAQDGFSYKDSMQHVNQVYFSMLHFHKKIPQK